MPRRTAIADKELRISLLRKIAEFDYVRIDDLFGLYLHSLSELTSEKYDTIELLKVLQEMCERDGWISCSRPEEPPGITTLDIDWQNARFRIVAITEIGKHFLETGKNPTSPFSRSTKKTNRMKIEKSVKENNEPILQLVLQKEHEIKEPKSNYEAKEQIAETIAHRRGQQEFRQRLIRIVSSPKSLVTQEQGYAAEYGRLTKGFHLERYAA